MKTIWLLLVILNIIITKNYSYAQDVEFNYDTSYIESYRDYMVVTFVMVNNSNDVSITDNLDDDIRFSTNMPFHFGFALDYKWFTLEYTHGFSKYGDSEMGETNSSSIGFGLTGRKFWFRNFWKRYEGYYMSSPEYYNPSFDPKIDKYIIRPDLRTSIYFANLNYGFNHRKYSNIASLWQLERQKRSAGSFTVGLSFANINFNSDSSLIQNEWANNFGSDVFITSFNLTVLGVNAGYLHTFSIFKKRRLFISLGLIPGISYQAGKAIHESSDNQPLKNAIGFQNEARLVVGYSMKKWYSSLSISANSIINGFAEKNSINQDYIFFRLMFGYKLKIADTKSKFLKKIGL